MAVLLYTIIVSHTRVVWYVGQWPCVYQVVCIRDKFRFPLSAWLLKRQRNIDLFKYESLCFEIAGILQNPPLHTHPPPTETSNMLAYVKLCCSVAEIYATVCEWCLCAELQMAVSYTSTKVGPQTRAWMHNYFTIMHSTPATCHWFMGKQDELWFNRPWKTCQE
jgi:hypothetical protein